MLNILSIWPILVLNLLIEILPSILKYIPTNLIVVFTLLIDYISDYFFSQFYILSKKLALFENMHF